MASPSPSEPGEPGERLPLLQAQFEDHFARLGLPRTHALDRDTVEDHYLQRAARVHPDRFANATSAERRAAMEASAALNEGYRILRDAVLRAEYLCKLAGIDIDSSDPQTGAPKMGQEFLVEMIERREQVAEARARGTGALDELRASVEEQLDDALDEALARLDDAAGPTAAAEALVKRRYLQRLLDEIDEAT